MFENEEDKKVHTGNYLPKVQINECNFMIDENIFLDHPVKTNFRTYDNIRKIAPGQCDDYTTGYLLDYNYSNRPYKMIAIYLSKQQALEALLTTN